MLKKKLSIILCTMMITGCFAQSAFAEEVKTNNTKANTTVEAAKDKTTENNTSKTAEQNKTNTASSKAEFPKIDFQMFSAKEAFDTDFHSYAYQNDLMNRVLNEETPLQKYFSSATMITCENAKFTEALNKMQKSKISTFEDGYYIESSKMSLKTYTEYINTHKNIPKDALDIFNEIIHQHNDTITVHEKQLKDDTAKFNECLKEARSFETPENKNDIENVLITGIMQLYWDSKEIPLEIKSLKELPANDKSTIEGLVKDANNSKASTTKKTSEKKAPAKTTPVTKTNATSTKALPKTGGFDAAPIASVSLILSGAALAIFNKIKRH